MNEVEPLRSSAPADGISPGVRGPFVGTRPFSKEEAAFFFGREREAVRLANLIIANTLTVLYGDSGVGKSSLINARLPRALEAIQPDWLTIPFFEWQRGCQSRLEEIIVGKTGAPLTGGLAKTLLSFADKTDRPVLLVLDQFEEYFLYHPHGLGSLDAELAKLINRRASQVHVLFSLRSDGLFLLDRLRVRIPNVFASMIVIEALNDKAAIDCVLLPLQAYNGLPGTNPVHVPARDSDLVRALVGGAEEEQILRRLPGRGRSELEQDDHRSTRIVAPFLQMALDALWQEDVINSGRDHLSLATLRKLAGLAPGQQSSEAVGAIAQRYVDSILAGFSEEEKAVCALILERMVLPSGQKVAVKLLDLASVLTPVQQNLAISILHRLSTDQTRRLIKMVAGVKDSEPHYQILHDAMAIPLLGWVEQWKGDERAARERREAEFERAAAQEREALVRRRAKTFAALVVAGVALVILGAVGYRYVEVKTQVQRLTSFAENDPRSGFRQPLLFSLGALEQANWWPIDRTDPDRVLRARLLRSPRDGGSFAAMGFDPATSTVAWMEQQSLVVCHLRETANCSASSESAPNSSEKRPRYALPLPFEGYAEMPDQSRNARLRQNQFPSVGFVTGLDTPVIYRGGLIYSRDGDRWVRDDLADLLPDLQQYPGMIIGEVLSGGLRVTVNDWPSSRMWATHLAFEAGTPRRWVPPPATNKWLNATWPPGNPAPMVSTNGALAANISVDRIPGGLRRMVDVTSAKQSETNASVEEKIELEKILAAESGTSTSLQAFVPAGTRSGLGFTPDNRFLAVLYRDLKRDRHVKLFDLATRPVIPAAFQFAAEVESSELLGNPFSFPPIATARVPVASNTASKTWRFAWLIKSGVRLVEADSGNILHEIEKTLLSGVDNASRLEFSADGTFLVMQSPDFTRRMVSVRVWDIGPAWKKVIEEARDFRALRKLACRVAAIDTDDSVVEKFETQEFGANFTSCPTDRVP